MIQHFKRAAAAAALAFLALIYNAGECHAFLFGSEFERMLMILLGGGKAAIKVHNGVTYFDTPQTNLFFYQPGCTTVPCDSHIFFASYWYNCSVKTNGEIFQVSTASGSSYVLVGDIFHQYVNSHYTLGVGFSADGENTGHNPSNWLLNSSNDIPCDSGWHNIIVSIQTGSGTTITANYVLDGITQAALTALTTPSSLVSGEIPWSTGTDWSIGQNSARFSFDDSFSGDLAEVYIHIGEYISMSATDYTHNAPLFVADVNGFPFAVGLRFECTEPTGHVPTMCQRGDQAHFRNSAVISTTSPYGPLYVLAAPQFLPERVPTDPCIYTSFFRCQP